MGNTNNSSFDKTKVTGILPEFWNQYETAVNPHKPKVYLNETDIIPDHYKVGGVETIDYIKAKMTQEQYEGYLLGNVIKYTSRFQHKNGVEDLKKAQWYLNKLIEVSDGQTSEVDISTR